MPSRLILPPQYQCSETPPSASELMEILQIPLKPPAVQLLLAHDTPAVYYRKLRDAGLLRDARLMLSHALPIRRALWWACLCAHDLHAPEQRGLAEAIEAVVGYVQRFDEPRRRAAEAVYRDLKPTTIAALLAGAAFFSRGSIAPPGAQPVAAPPYVARRLVSTVVYLAATTKNAMHYKHCLREYLTVGEEVAAGRHLWETPPLPQSPRGDDRHVRLDLRHPVPAATSPQQPLHLPSTTSQTCQEALVS